VSAEAAQLLVNRLEAASARWPLHDEIPIIRRVAKWAAYREADGGALSEFVGWNELHPDRAYYVDPLAEKISQVYADLLFGEDPRIIPKAVADLPNYEHLAEVSDLPDELHWAEELCSSEGETWWRIFSDELAAEHPVIEFHSRLDVIPHWIGIKLVAVGFISEYRGDEVTGQKTDERHVWRRIEIHTRGRVENRLYEGTETWLGEPRDLTAFSETAELVDVWDHALPGMLAGRVVNRRGRSIREGRSDYHGIEHYLQMLNETVTIGQENARLTLKKRAVVPESSLVPPSTAEHVDAGDGTMRVRQRASFDASEDVLVDRELDKTLGEGGAGQFKVLEYSFDADGFVVYKRDLIVSALTRVGITPQFVGSFAGFEGTADTGTALRVRLIPTDLAGRGKGRRWDKALPEILSLAALVDAAPTARFGFGVGWASPGDPPAVERPDPLPEDELEQTTRHVAATASKAIESQRTAIEEMHPDWDETRVNEELDRIAEDTKRATPPALQPFGAKPGQAGDEDEPANPPPDADAE
jgi:hypothetical protein